MKHILAKIAAIAALLLSASVTDIFACTSVIVSGRVTADGRPLMLKVRDQSESKRNNTAGFCIMSLTAHGFPAVSRTGNSIRNTAR